MCTEQTSERGEMQPCRHSSGRRLGRPDANNAARLAVAERAESERTRRIERAPGLDAVAAQVRPFEMAAGDAVADREIRAAAAHGETDEDIRRELIIEPAREPTGIVGKGGAADPCFAAELCAAVKAGEPCPPARLQPRWVLGEERLEGWMIGFGLFRWGGCQ